MSWQVRTLAATAIGFALSVAGSACAEPAAARASSHIRAAYFYNYMDYEHIDSLAAHGFNLAVIHTIGDSLSDGQAQRLVRWIARGNENGMQVVPKWRLQSIVRLEALGSTRRYTWGRGHTDTNIPCPLDAPYWRSALLDRAEETIAGVPDAGRLAVDLELEAETLTHYDAGPCRCDECLAEYTGMPLGWYKAGNAWRLTGLMSYEESRLTDIFYEILRDFAARHPGVELAVLDLDLDSFVHRALGRALALTGVPTTDYCERSYAVAGAPLRGARARLDALGLEDAALVGGLWLKRFAPANLGGALRSISERANGYFIFSTYSLWRDVSELHGPYTLLGRPSDYWTALHEVNRSP